MYTRENFIKTFYYIENYFKINLASVFTQFLRKFDSFSYKTIIYIYTL